MMTNLFSIFDPSTSLFNFKLNWMIVIISLMMLPTYFWLMGNRYSTMSKKPFNMLNNEFNVLMMKKMKEQQ